MLSEKPHRQTLSLQQRVWNTTLCQLCHDGICPTQDPHTLKKHKHGGTSADIQTAYSDLPFSIFSSSSIATVISLSNLRSSAIISLVGGYSTGLYSVCLYLLMDRS